MTINDPTAKLMSYREWKADLLEQIKVRHMDRPDEEELAIHFEHGRTPAEALAIILAERGTHR